MPRYVGPVAFLISSIFAASVLGQEFEQFVIDGERSRVFYQSDFQPPEDAACRVPGCTYRIEGTFAAKLTFDQLVGGDLLVSFAEFGNWDLSYTLISGDTDSLSEALGRTPGFPIATNLWQSASMHELLGKIDGELGVASLTDDELLIWFGGGRPGLFEVRSTSIFAVPVPEPDMRLSFGVCLLLSLGSRRSRQLCRCCS